MVKTATILASNGQITSQLQSGLVAVFAGVTSGIGEATLRTFVRYAVDPRVYIIARSARSANRVAEECKQINPRATFTIIIADLNSIQQTDRACQQILHLEKYINIVFHSAGEVLLDRSLTDEGLHSFLACAYYSKLRTIQQLLPRLEAAAATSPSSLARVVAVGGGGKEGLVDVNDFPAFQIPLPKVRDHLTSMITFSLEELALTAPHVSFVHNFPGIVRTSLFDDIGGIIGLLKPLIMAYFHVGEYFGWREHLGLDECAERQVFLATTSIYPAREFGAQAKAGVQVPGDSTARRGADGVEGSGVYSIEWDCEPAPASVEAILREQREKGIGKLALKHTTDEFDRIEEKYRG